MSGKLRPILAMIVVLAAALVADEARAGIVAIDSPASPDRGGDAILQSSFDDLFSAGASASRPLLPGSDDREDPTPRVEPRTPDGGGLSCDPASISPTGSSSVAAAIPSHSAHLSDASLETTLPREATVMLTTGPPFELLRPA